MLSKNQFRIIVVIGIIYFFDGGSRSRRYLSVSLEEDEKSSKRQLNILSLGGSVTWGAKLDNRYNAYPYQLQKDYGHNVTDLAIRATGSDYPAQCISSMLRDEEEEECSSFRSDTPFDVIILEFSLNGLDGFSLLHERLIKRFPDALFIYVELFSLIHKAFDSTKVLNIVRDGHGIIYYFGNTGEATNEFNIQESINLTAPGEEISKYFADDSHHLNYFGHKLVATKVMEIIEKHEFPLNPKLGTWLGGDLCNSWFEDGNATLLHVVGGEINEFNNNSHKWALEVQQDGAIIEYNHDGENDAPISLQYMTSEAKYPPVTIKIEQSLQDVEKAKEDAHKDNIGLVRKSEEETESIATGWRYLSGCNGMEGLRRYHITEVSHIGSVTGGMNFIYIHPTENRTYPFRLTAIIVCEACGQLGWNEDIEGIRM